MYHNQIIRALKIALKAHEGQTDKGGNPYILHVMSVAIAVNGKTMIAAFLHDIVEDTEWTIEKLQQEGFDDETIEAVDLLTRKKNVSYNQYIDNISKNEIARTVKIADLRDNMDISRIKLPTKIDFDRVKKYEKSLKILEFANG